MGVVYNRRREKRKKEKKGTQDAAMERSPGCSIIQLNGERKKNKWINKKEEKRRRRKDDDEERQMDR